MVEFRGTFDLGGGMGEREDQDVGAADSLVAPELAHLLTTPQPDPADDPPAPPEEHAEAEPAPAVLPVEDAAAMLFEAAGPAPIRPPTARPDPPTARPDPPTARPADWPVGPRRILRGPGERFQPVPGAQLIDGRRSGGNDAASRDDLAILASERTPVHTVAGGTVTALTTADDGGTLCVRDDEGWQYTYRGLDAAAIAVEAGQEVEAGQILAVVGVASDGPSGLWLEVRDAGGHLVDPYRLLLGLPDPNELGYAAHGPGPDIDPDAPWGSGSR